MKLSLPVRIKAISATLGDGYPRSICVTEKYLTRAVFIASSVDIQWHRCASSNARETCNTSLRNASVAFFLGHRAHIMLCPSARVWVEQGWQERDSPATETGTIRFLQAASIKSWYGRRLRCDFVRVMYVCLPGSQKGIGVRESRTSLALSVCSHPLDLNFFCVVQ